MSRRLFISPFREIFWNLALEDWLYKHGNFNDSTVILIWINRPCIVIGRHQNPFHEVNFNQLNTNNVPLSRRNSGGGTVYHDEGNLNFTFFTKVDNYCRKNNLKFIKSVLENNFGFDKLSVNRNDDLLYDGRKISGSAAKLSRNNGYHHFTLLINSDLNMMSNFLKPTPYQDHIEKTSTISKRSQVINLSKIKPELNINEILNCLQPAPLSKLIDLNTIDDQLRAIYNHLKGWNWIYGKTPDFHFKSERINIAVIEGRIAEIYCTNVDQKWLDTFIGVKFDVFLHDHYDFIQKNID